MSWLMENSTFKKDINWGAKNGTFDLTHYSTNRDYTSDNSVLQHIPNKEHNLKASSVSKNRSVERKIRTEKQIVDLVARELTRNPHLIKSLPGNTDYNNITDALNRIQSSIYQSTGRSVNLIKAYATSERTLGLLHRLLALAAKGVIVPASKLYNTKGFSASRGSASQRIYLLSASQATSNQFRKIGKMAGLYNSKPAITHFREEAINALKAYLPDPKKRINTKRKNLFDELSMNYGAETWGRNDTNTNDVMSECDDYIHDEQAPTKAYRDYVKSLAYMTDQALAQNVWDGFISKGDLRAALKGNPRRLSKVSSALQKLARIGF